MGSLSGHCACGAITYSVSADPAMTILCHCDDCQRTSGAAFSVNVAVPADALSIEGQPKTFVTKGEDHGNERERQFCPECGSQLFTVLTDMPQLMVIKAGTLDDKSAVAPQMEIWLDSKQAWTTGDQERNRFQRDLQM